MPERVPASMPDPSNDRSAAFYRRFMELEAAYDAAHGRVQELEAECDRYRAALADIASLVPMPDRDAADTAKFIARGALDG